MIIRYQTVSAVYPWCPCSQTGRVWVGRVGYRVDGSSRGLVRLGRWPDGGLVKSNKGECRDLGQRLGPDF